MYCHIFMLLPLCFFMYGVNEKYVALPSVGESTLHYGEKVLYERGSSEVCLSSQQPSED
jgi:hypothetical protein